MYENLKDELSLKADLTQVIIDFNEFKHLFSRTALLEDYKELYERVVPPITTFK